MSDEQVEKAVPGASSSAAEDTGRHEQLMQELEATRRASIAQCVKDLEAVLTRHGCALAPTPYIEDGMIHARVDVVKR